MAASSAAAAEAASSAAAGDEQPPAIAGSSSSSGGGAAGKRTLRYRTADVESDASSFADLLLPPHLVRALAAAGFERPSPVQKAAIPLARLGGDVIVQAKSGTGKTAVFAAALLERVALDVGTPQAVVLAPTRELALQSHAVVERVAAGLPQPAPAAAVFVGGLPTADDEKRLRRTCHIVVGTPGRVCALATSGALLLGRIRSLVLDEADQLLGEGFYADVAWLHQQLPTRPRCQVLAFSATYTPALLADLEPLMRRPQRVLLCKETASLLGIRQFYKLVDDDDDDGDGGGGGGGGGEGGCGGDAEGGSAGHATANGTAAGAAAAQSAAANGAAKQQQPPPKQPATQQQQALLQRKVDALLALLARVSFHQAAVFCGRRATAEWLARRLTAAGCPAAHLSGDLPQPERAAAMAAVRAFKARVVVSTDVMARGVDLDRVNLVVSLELPPDAATYVHRVGRTGRFGSRGVAVSLVSRAELAVLRGYLDAARYGELAPLPEVVPDDLYRFELESDWERDALAALLQAPTGAPPAGPPPLRAAAGPRLEEAAAAAAAAGRSADADDAAAEQAAVAGGGAAAAAAAGAGVDHHDQRQHQQQQQQQQDGVDAADAWDAWAAYYRALGYAYDHANPYRQADADAGAEAEAEADAGADAGEEPLLPADDGDVEPHALRLVERLQVADAAAESGAADADAAAARPNGAASAATELPPLPPSPPPAAAEEADGDGALCGGCWVRAYGAWRRDYGEWRARYEAWQRAAADAQRQQ